MKSFRVIFPWLCAVLLLLLCVYKVGNTDFWWHIKAGQVLRSSGWIITDPFAYTRVGQAYLAHHEWLAQVALSLVYDFTGPVGIIVMRTLMVLVTFGILLLLDKSKAWVHSGLALLAALLARPALTDRPQLFTFMLFSIVLFFCLAYLKAKKSERRVILFLLPVLIVLWSNLHGAAGVVGIALMGALALQRIMDSADRKEVEVFFLVIIASCLALIATPSGLDNVLYAFHLFGDKTTELIAEWQSPSWSAYVRHVGIFWVIALLALWKGKKHYVFSVLVLFGIGYLSKSAVRHEVLFLIAALGVTVHQLRDKKLLVSQCIANVLQVGAITLLTGMTVIQMQKYNNTNTLFGFGEFTPLLGASDFIVKEGISGNMFNNYNAGGELLFRGHRVFLDGRNLDYGYDYLSRAVDAGINEDTWTTLEEEYNFTHAVVYYALEGNSNPIPYITLLQQSPRWGLQYLDDWTAVYVKGAGDQYQHITPTMLYHTQMPEEISLGDLQELEQEAQQIMEHCPECTKAPAYLEALRWSFDR